MWLLVQSLLVLVISGLYWYFTRTFDYWKENNVVGPKPLPFFGNTKETALRRQHPGDVYKAIYDQFQNEKVVGLYRMTSPCMLVRDLDLVKDILIKNFDSFSDRGLQFSTDGLGFNLFHASGEPWRLLRNSLSPIFTSGKLKNMFYLLDERSEKFIEYISAAKKREFEINAILKKYTISAISACAFGLDIDLNDDKKMEPLHRLDKRILTTSHARELDMLFPGILSKLNMSAFPAEAATFFNDLVSAVIKQRNEMPSPRKDFMDSLIELLQAGDVQGYQRSKNEQISLKVTQSVITAQAFIFFVGGYETSSSTMTYMLYELARNPNIQDKLMAEIDEALQRNNGKITYEILSEMTYLTQVFNETLRLHPIIDSLQRSAKVNYKLPGTDVVVKKGTMMMIPVLAFHRDANLYPDPLKFDPERFAAENVKDRHPCAYIPFGSGPRNCIGMRFGRIQSLVGVVKLLSKFRVEPSLNTPEPLPVDPGRVIYSPKSGICLNLVPRDKAGELVTRLTVS